MAIRLTAKGALRAEILRLEELGRDYKSDFERSNDRAERRDYKALANEAEMRIQALRYALNFLESEKEVPCPD